MTSHLLNLFGGLSLGAAGDDPARSSDVGGTASRWFGIECTESVPSFNGKLLEVLFAGFTTALLEGQ